MYLKFVVCIFSDEKLKLKSMFREPDKVVDLIVNKYEIMSEMMAEYLMESSISPVAVSIRDVNSSKEKK